MTAFGGAMTSNVAFALRGLLSKKVKAESKSENLTSSNLYSILTLISFFLFYRLLWCSRATSSVQRGRPWRTSRRSRRRS